MATATYRPVAGAASRGRRRDMYVHLYTQLVKRVRESDLLRRRYGYYWTVMSLTVLALAGVVAGLVLLGDSWFQLLLAAPLAVVSGQLAFIGHDAAHRQIFWSHRANDWAGLINGTLLGGLSAGWWMPKHNRHHGNPNKQGTDPDIAPGFVAFTPDSMERKRGPAAQLARRQGYLFLPLLLFEGLHLHVRSVQRIFSRAPMKRRGWEAVFLFLRLGGYIAALLVLMSPAKAAAFLGLQLGLFGLYMGGSFAPNHVGMPIVPPNLKLDFLRRQVLMSRNITGGRLIHFAMGGLNFQIEHHLFPNMPRPNLRRVQPLVRGYCATHNIPYTEQNLLDAYKAVIGYLNNVGLAARDPYGCPLAAQLRAPA
jgi:fatty acid desaturase